MEKMLIVHSFCTVTDSMDHGPCGIWTYLEPVLTAMQNENPILDTLHIFSDGPSTQYKQKGNFYLFSTELAKKGIEFGTWNLHEVGRGKGEPDGIGGVLKRIVSQKVLHGNDIKDAASFKEMVEGDTLNISLYYVKPEDVEKKKTLMPSLKTVPGTMKLHQLITMKPGEIFYRDVSCTFESNIHDGHNLKTFVFQEVGDKKTKTKCLPPVVDNTANIEINSESPALVDYETMRSIFFWEALTSLEKMKTINEIKDYCESIQNDLDKYEVRAFTASVVNTGLNIKMYPPDIKQISVMYPVSVTGNGNCLPYLIQEVSSHLEKS